MLQECNICKATVDAKELANYERYVDIEGSFSEVTRFTFLQCPRCERPFVVSQFPLDWSPQSIIWGSAKTLLPEPYKRVDPSLPQSIRTAFEEALACIRSGAHTACVIMCRKTLEAVCREYQVGGRDLAAMLNTMREKHLIDKRLFEWADELRLAGNEAAHEAGSSVTLLDMRDIVDFTHALLEYTFTIRDKFNAFMARKKKRHDDRVGGSKDEEVASAQEDVQGSGTDVPAPN